MARGKTDVTEPDPPPGGGQPDGGGGDGGQGDGGQGDGEAGRIKSLNDRFGALERKQAEQDGVLQKILAAVGGQGDSGGAPPAGDGGGAPPATSGTTIGAIQQQVRDEIAAADRRRAEQDAAEADKSWRTGVDQFMEELKTERTPRDPQSGLRGALQRALLGGGDR